VPSIQWTKAPWGGGAAAAALPRSFELPRPVTPMLARAAVDRAAQGSRTRLWELAGMLHCSVIGTCLTTAELRQVLVKLGLATAEIDDHAAHKVGVTIAAHHDAAGKKLHKVLDERHRQAIARFARVRTQDEVRALWKQALQCADIPGGYWATITHPAAGHALIAEAFGDVHMLSHLVGAANRADIRRLRDLEAELAVLRESLDRQQNRLRDAIVNRDATIRDLRAALATRVASEPAPADDATERALRALVGDLEGRLAAETARRHATDQKLSQSRADLQRERAQRTAAEASVAALHADIDAIEQRLPLAGDAAPALPDLGGMRVLYVGGRPSLLTTLHALAERLNMTLLTHDGGIEENGATLAAQVSRAELVLFPVDCISHRAVIVVKRICERSGKPFVALRTASTSAFLASMSRFAPEVAAP
jgi:hypothetical protein